MKNEGAQTKTRSGLVAALDIGSTKICCMIARPSVDRGPYGGKGPQIVGIGHQISMGLRSGTIIDLDKAEASVRMTVETAEQMAGENIRDVVVNVSGGEPQSRLIAYEISIAGHQIGDSDLRHILDPANLLGDQPSEREILHSIPVGYSIDGNRGVRDPRGMYGERLGINMHVISALSGPVRNLETTIARCHLGVESLIVSPYASALAVLVEDEMQLGATCIDIGGGTTSIGVFFDGGLVHIDSIPVGGIHVTNDIARGLSTPLAQAERMKTLYGSAIPSSNDDREVINVPLVGEEAPADASPVPRSMLIGIIRPRIEEILEMVRERLQIAGFDKVVGRRLVLTGGASQLPGVGELAATILDKQVRLGRPMSIDGLAEAVAGPMFSTCVGLLQYAVTQKAEVPSAAYQPVNEPNRHFGRFGQWLKENF